MIIKSYDDAPFSTCTEASLLPERKGEFSGTLFACGEDFRVSVTREERRGELERVWARVKIIEEVPKSEVDRYAIAVAEKSLADHAWDQVKVDLRDGETAYMRTWTLGFPDDAGMDEFLRQAKSFIEDNLDTLRELAGTDDVGFDISSLF